MTYVNGREIVFWMYDQNAEELVHKSREAAIEEALRLNPEFYNKPFKIYGFACMVVEVPRMLALRFAEELIEELDSAYGGEDGTELTTEMKELADKFVADFTALYEPYACEIVREEWINGREQWRRR